ncbi:unnamed protein product [Paramecium sonneborni]|uniref:RING-type domain-containing protein n=1 Tax=Paramecium sonneborni TaxID=65129 RepID=A0A8S1PZU7_9CILI|nr:unnamed protein product [Paramecium sonneborni]
MSEINQSFKIIAYFDNVPKKFTIKRDKTIKKQICSQFNIKESKMIFKINNENCDLEDDLEKYFKQDQKHQIVEIFDINQLIENYKEIQSQKYSQILHSTQKSYQKVEDQNQINDQTQQVNNQTDCDKDDKIDQNYLKEKDSFIIIENQKVQEMESLIFLKSIILDKQYTCRNCQQEIQECKVQTPCYHFFHYECLDSLIYNALQQQATTLQCLCNQKFNIQILKLFDEQKQKTYQNLLLQNQLLCIQKNYDNKIGRCIDNEQSKFWFFVQKQSQILKKIQCFECIKQ